MRIWKDNNANRNACTRMIQNVHGRGLGLGRGLLGLGLGRGLGLRPGCLPDKHTKWEEWE